MHVVMSTFGTRGDVQPFIALAVAFKLLGEHSQSRVAGLVATLRPLAQHAVPPRARWSYIFVSATLAAFLIQVVTGAALATLYVPSTGQAYESLRFITENAFLGSLLRGAHFFGASAMIALLGATGLAVGLALKDTLQNIAAGFILLSLRPFRVGDVIQFGQTMGTVRQVGLFTTALDTSDGLRITAPNSAAVSQPKPAR